MKIICQKFNFNFEENACDRLFRNVSKKWNAKNVFVVNDISNQTATSMLNQIVRWKEELKIIKEDKGRQEGIYFFSL